MKFKERSACVVNQYSAAKNDYGDAINGELTINEELAAVLLTVMTSALELELRVVVVETLLGNPVGVPLTVMPLPPVLVLTVSAERSGAV